MSSTKFFQPRSRIALHAVAARHKIICRSSIKKTLLFRLSVFCTYSVISVIVHAQSLYWDSNSTGTGGAGTTPTGTWGSSNFWNSSSTGLGGALQSTTTSANNLFFSAGTDAIGTYTVSLPNNASVSANSVTVQEGNVTINQGNGAGSTINLGGGGFTIDSGARLTLSGSKLTVALAAAQTWTNNSSNIFNVNVPITNAVHLLTIGGTGDTSISGVIGNGSGGLTKTGAGKLTLSTANTYTGLTTVNAGTLEYGVNNAISTGAVTVDGATAVLSLLTSTDTVGTVTVDNGGSITGGVGGTLTSTSTFEMKNGSVSAILAGAGIAINKTSAGTVTLSGANTYSGLTTISGGTLSYGANNVIGTGGVTINGGTLNMAGNTDSIGAFTLTSGTLKMAASQTGTTQLISTGGVAFGTTNTLDLTGMATTAGIYKLVAGTSLGGTFGTVTGLDSNYVLRYGTVNANELDAQRRADQSISAANLGRRLSGSTITGVTLGTLTNTSPTGATALAVGLSSTGPGGIGSITGLAASTGATVSAAGSATITGNVNVGTTLGAQSFSISNTDGNAITTLVTNSTGSVTVVDQRNFSVGTPTIALGRFLINTTPAGTTAISSNGLNNVTANATLGSFSGTNTNGLTLTTVDPTAFNGASGSQTANYSIGGSIASAGALSGASFSSPVTAELGSIPNVVVNVTGSALASRTVTSPTTTSLGTYHAGAAVNVISNSFGYNYGAGGTGAHSDTEDTTVQAYSGAADANGITLSGGLNNINSAAGFARTFTGTAAVNSSSGSFNLVVNPELSATTNVSAGYTIGVYSGDMIWSGASGNWATGSNWTDSVAGGTSVAPGLDVGFTMTDSATFGNTAGSVTVSLNGSTPSLNEIVFNNTGSYSIAQGSGGNIKFAGSNANITASGTHAIGANVTLGVDIVAAITNGIDSLTVSGIISEILGFHGLTKTGDGTLILSAINTFTGGTTISDGILALSGAGALDNSSSVNANGATSVFDISSITAASETIGSLTGVLGSAINLGAKNLTTGGNNSSTIVAGIISGLGGSLTKTGSGAMELTGANTYSGNTTVLVGELIVNSTSGSGTGTGTVTIASGASLSGNGTIGGPTTFQDGSFHKPGNTPGIQSFSTNLTYDANSTFVWELIDNTLAGRGLNYDGVNGSTGGVLSIDSNANSMLVFNSGSIVDWNSSFWDSNQSWLVFSGFDVLAGTGLFNISGISVDSNNQPFSAAGGSFSWSAVGNDVYLNYSIASVPEPASIGGSLVLFGSWFARRRYQRKRVENLISE